jgi:integrase
MNEAKHKEELMHDSQTFGWTLHDLRRTTATRMAEIGIAPRVIKCLLGHAMPGVAARYNHASYISELRDALKK